MKRISMWILGLAIFSVCMIGIFGGFTATSNIKPEWYDSEMNLGYSNEYGYYYYVSIMNDDGNDECWMITDVSEEVAKDLFERYDKTVPN